MRTTKKSEGEKEEGKKEEDGAKKESMNREAARSFEDLQVWQKAHAFVLGIYRMTAKFPSNETYGLSTQMRRAAVSVPANIAEGFKRRGKPDKARLMNVAEASLEEVRYYLRLATDLGYLSDATLAEDAAEVNRMLGAYARRILFSS
jgi:four helix bundle protein